MDETFMVTFFKKIDNISKQKIVSLKKLNQIENIFKIINKKIT